MFLAGLFTIAKRWKQHKCPLTDKWINKILFEKSTDTCYNTDEP